MPPINFHYYLFVILFILLYISKMSTRKYYFTLTPNERYYLESCLTDAHLSRERKRRAEALLLMDASLLGSGLSPSAVSNLLDTGTAFTSQLARRCVEEGVYTALWGKRAGGAAVTHPGPKPKLSPDDEQALKELHAAGQLTLQDLARQFGVSWSTAKRSVTRTSD